MAAAAVTAVAAWTEAHALGNYSTDDEPAVDGLLALLRVAEARRPAWQLDAACRSMPVALFFPEPRAPAPEAEAACATCPVAEHCAADGAALGRRGSGVWGGRRVYARARCGPARRCIPRRG